MEERLHQFVGFGERLRESYPHPALKVPFFVAAMLIFAASALAFRLFGDWKEEVGALGHIGIGLKNIGRLGWALQAMQRCRAIGERNGADPQFLSIYFGEVGDLQVMLGRPADGLADLRTALQFASETDRCRRHYQIAEALLGLGVFGNYAAADYHLTEAERLADAGQFAHPSHRVGTVLARAKYLLGLARGDEALLRAQEALALAKRLGLPIRVEQAQALIEQIESKNP